jgi:hypothetical protein
LIWVEGQCVSIRFIARRVSAGLSPSLPMTRLLRAPTASHELSAVMVITVLLAAGAKIPVGLTSLTRRPGGSPTGTMGDTHPITVPVVTTVAHVRTLPQFGGSLLPDAKVLGLPSLDGWALISAIALLAVLLISWVLLRRRRRSASEDTFDSSGRPVR